MTLPCPVCGDTGTTLEGEVCECQINTEFSEYTFTEPAYQYIPDAYKGVMFNRGLVKGDLSPAYPNLLETTLNDVVSSRMKNTSLMICSPVGYSKTIMAYTANEKLSRRKIATAPIADLIEIQQGLLNTYNKKITPYEVDVNEMFKVPYLFIEIPLEITQPIMYTISTILSRRVRGGGSTIFLYGGAYSQLTYMDKNDMWAKLMGDGSFKSILVHNFRK